MSRLLCVGLGLGLILVAGGAARVEAGEPEYELKARILSLMLPYVVWPHLEARADTHFDLVVLGKSPFGKELDRALRTQTIRQRPIRIRYLSRFADLGSCDALFLCASESSQAGRITAWARDNKVLTISDTKALSEKGIMVNLVLDESNRKSLIRMAINLDEAKAGGISIDSRLLPMAEIVKLARAPESAPPGRQP